MAHDSLEARAHAWMLEHPEAMEVFERLALEAVKARQKFSIGLLTERVRWEAKVSKWHDGFAVNNNHRAYIARELIRRHPVLAKWLELRCVQGEVLPGCDAAMPAGGLFDGVEGSPC